MKYHLLSKQLLRITFLLLFTATHVSGQIAMDKAYYDSQRGITTQLPAFVLNANAIPSNLAAQILSKIGGNQTFDFSEFPLPENPFFTLTRTTLSLGASHPFQDVSEFEEANFISQLKFSTEPFKTTWSYAKITDDTNLSIGSGVVYDETNEKELMDFGLFGWTEPIPKTMGSEWSTTSKLETGGFDVSIIEYNTIDAWGTLILPGGKSEGALRVRLEKEMVSGSITVLPRYLSGYNYITLSGLTASVELDEDDVDSVNFITFAYPTTGTTVSINDGDTVIPKGFTLSQNYPNPFNPSTKIEYSIPFSADVSLTISDSTGRIVSVIEHPRKQAGTHTFDVNMANVASGVYIYRLDAGGYSLSRKFSFIK